MLAAVYTLVNALEIIWDEMYRLEWRIIHTLTRGLLWCWCIAINPKIIHCIGRIHNSSRRYLHYFISCMKEWDYFDTSPPCLYRSPYCLVMTSQSSKHRLTEHDDFYANTWQVTSNSLNIDFSRCCRDLSCTNVKSLLICMWYNVGATQVNQSSNGKIRTHRYPEEVRGHETLLPPR